MASRPSPTVLAEDAEAAVTEAEKLGYPVVLKLNSETITHKSDVEGVQLNLRDPDAVRKAYDLIQTTVSRTRRRGALPGRHCSAHDQARRL